jgi:hypothetical protein
MQSLSKSVWRGAAIVSVAIALAGLTPNGASAQTGPSVQQSAVTLSEVTIKALQEALNKQGIAVAVDGVLNQATREAIKKYQSQHHLPVTGEPDTATLAKLGVATRQSAAPAQTQAQTPPQPGTTGQAGGAPAPGGLPTGATMNCPMMQGQMQAMMQMMQGMMQMMQSMHGQMQPGQMGPGQMQPGQMDPGQMSPGQMQRGNTGSGPPTGSN